MPQSNDTSKSVFIYTLSDPRDNAIRYVGQTEDPQRRLSGHMHATAAGFRLSEKERWISSLMEVGLKPILSVVAEVKRDNGDDAEQWWINRLYILGCPLTNKEIVRWTEWLKRRAKKSH